jgi:hypothetical protein
MGAWEGHTASLTALTGNQTPFLRPYSATANELWMQPTETEHVLSIFFVGIDLRIDKIREIIRYRLSIVLQTGGMFLRNAGNGIPNYAQS